MKLRSLLREMESKTFYASEKFFESQQVSGVSFVLRKMSAARRLHLVERLGELASRLEALQASDRMDDRVQAEALRIRMDREYLFWGLKSIEGIEIDGAPADAEILFEQGPEALVAEIVGSIRRECEFSPAERKN